MAEPPLIPPRVNPSRRPLMKQLSDAYRREGDLERQVAAYEAELRRLAGRERQYEHAAPSATYLELERLLGYAEPTGYRAEPSTPQDFVAGRGRSNTDGVA
jgi:hypothetical protein